MILIPYRINKTFIIEHRNYIFLYGHDVARRGMLGQEWPCIAEPNCFPISTVGKLCPSIRQYFDDNRFDAFQKILDKDFERIPKDGRAIIPFRKIGEGCSEMKKRAPLLFAYMTSRINEIKHPNIKIDYGS